MNTENQVGKGSSEKKEFEGQKWEYLFVEIEYPGLVQQPRVTRVNENKLPKNYQVSEFLNQTGEQGWELIVPFTGFSSGATKGLIFKRPKT